MTRLENYETLFKNIETNVKIILEALSNRLPANSEIDKYEKGLFRKSLTKSLTRRNNILNNLKTA